MNINGGILIKQTRKEQKNRVFASRAWMGCEWKTIEEKKKSKVFASQLQVANSDDQRKMKDPKNLSSFGFTKMV